MLSPLASVLDRSYCYGARTSLRGLWGGDTARADPSDLASCKTLARSKAALKLQCSVRRKRSAVVAKRSCFILLIGSELLRRRRFSRRHT